MSVHTVTVILQTADRTRKAQVTVPRTMTVADVIKASRGKWRLSMGMDFQIVNMNTNRQLLAHDTLSNNNVQNGDVLMLQPFPTHGGGERHQASGIR